MVSQKFMIDSYSSTAYQNLQTKSSQNSYRYEFILIYQLIENLTVLVMC